MTDLALLAEPYAPTVADRTFLHAALDLVLTCGAYAGLGMLALGAYCLTAY